MRKNINFLKSAVCWVHVEVFTLQSDIRCTLWWKWQRSSGKISHPRNIWVNFARTSSYFFLSTTNLTHLFQCIYLFHFPTCFEQPSVHHQENQLYQYVIWYISLCVGDLHRVIYTRWCIDTIDSPDDEHWVARNM